MGYLVRGSRYEIGFLQGDKNVMNKTNVCRALIASILLTSFWYTPKAHADLNEGLVGHYRFDEGIGTTTADQSDSARRGTLVGGVAWVPGVYGSALQFNGADAMVETGESFLSGLTEFTLAGWISAANPTAGRIALFGQNDTLECGFNNSEVGIYTPSNAGGGWQWIGVPYTFAYPSWHHVAISANMESIILYVDGEEVASGSVGASTFGTSGDPFNIGAATLDATGNWFDGEIDDVWVFVRALTAEEILEVMAGGIEPTSAAKPIPEDGMSDVPRDSDLSWTASKFAQKHDVYFGTVWGDVNDATSPVSQGQSASAFDPGRLDFGQTYYWRVDEVNGAPDNTVFKGEVWSFTVEPYARPITNVTAMASSSQAANMGPEKTVDGSGLDALDQHGIDGTAMWLSGMGDATPSIQFEFDKVYKLANMLVWNSNQIVESFIGLGAKDVVIETSVDGAEWTVVQGATLLNQATGSPTYTANTDVDFGGVQARFVRITISAGWGFMPQYGLSEVRFLYVPTFAREPDPANGSAVASASVDLAWRSGREAASHEVWLGTDPNALALVGATSEPAYTAGSLSFSSTYFWSITEVNNAEAVTAHAGDIWSFATPDYGIVDSFDQYNDECERIFFAWEDGLGHNGGDEIEDCEVPASNGNGGGSIVGNNQAPFAERTIVNIGSTQSLPFSYDNAFGLSEATLSIDGQDWTASGIQTLAIAFYGTEGNTGTLYVKINNTKIVYDLDPGDIARSGWQAWNIDLTGVGGLQNVTSLTIGVDGASAAGMLYIDDMRLYAQPGEILTPVQPDSAGLVAHYSFDEGAGTTVGDSSGNGTDGTVMGVTQWVPGKIGGAMAFNGFENYVDCGNNAIFDITDVISLSVWVNANDAGNGEHNMWLGKGDHSYAIKHQTGNNIEFFVHEGGNWHVVHHPLDDSFNGAWHHVAGTFDGSQLALYLDGMLVSTTDYVGPINASTHAVAMGSNSEVAGRFYEGQLDDARIYNRVLTPAEILHLAGRTQPVHEPF